MTKWNNKSYQKKIIDNYSFICSKCNVLTNISSGIDYYYFGNGKNAHNVVDDRFYLSAGIVTTKEYYLGDYITWKCNICEAITVSEPFNKKPVPILPNNKELFEIEKCPIKDNNLKKLIKEFYTVRNLKLNSSATLLARKILMFIAIEQKLSSENEKFIKYVDDIKNSQLVSKNWKPKIDLIRQIGNQENHKITIATDEDLENISNVLKHLLECVYLK